MEPSNSGTMSLPKKKCRQYSQSYLKLGFISSPGNDSLPLCLICGKTFQNDAMKPSKMKGHMERMHPDEKDRDLEYFENLKEKFITCSQSALKLVLKTDPPPSVSRNAEGGLQASYNIALLIAKAGYPHSIAEQLILPSVREVISKVMKMDPQPVLKSIPLSNSTVQRRIDEMAEDIQKFLVSELQISKFSVMLNEDTLGNSSLLMSYVRYYSQRKKEITEEFLFSEQMENYTTGEMVFIRFGRFLHENNIPLSNITAISYDGAPGVIDKYREFLTIMRKKVANIQAVHCIIHRQHLVSKNISEKLNEVLELCVKSINSIKTRALNDGLFAKLCDKSNEIHNQMLLQTEIRWLSKGNYLQRFVELFDRVVEFFIPTNKFLAINLMDVKNHVFYLADLYSKINDIQIKMQGKDMLQSRTIIFEFHSKIDLFISSLEQRDFIYFTNLLRLSKSRNNTISNDDLVLYIDHLTKLKEDFTIRFQDLGNLEVPVWILQPFECDLSQIEVSLQEELIEMKEDLEAKTLFDTNGYEIFWNNQDIRTKYAKLQSATEELFLTFPSINIVEAGFNEINNLLKKSRKKMNLPERGDLRIKLSNYIPNISQIMTTHQAQSSH